MFAIRKCFEFSASHVLAGLPADHPCTRLHGHNYRVTVELTAGDLDCAGFVWDYRNLDGVKRWLDDTFDHRHLNDVVPVNPSAENLARMIFEVVAGPELGLPGRVTVEAVAVEETPKTWAEYRP
jgi:6-pyruvoyltetrahydropterin/6-carboxytetrahydropterin synthase